MSKNITHCIVCGAPIEYKTKKPKWCSKCKDAKNTVRKPKTKSSKSKKTKWKGETGMYKVLDELMPKTQYCVSGYYSWLPSPKNQPLQLDWYSYELGIAFEYQGQQHYDYSRYFHKTKAAFKYLKQCDKIKKKVCEEEGISLISIKYDVDLNVRSLASEIKKQDKKKYECLLKNGDLNLTKEDIKAIK